MEHYGSLPHWQKTATYPNPQPDQISPHPLSHFLKINFSIILLSTPRSCTCSLTLMFPYRNHVSTSLLHPLRAIFTATNIQQFNQFYRISLPRSTFEIIVSFIYLFFFKGTIFFGHLYTLQHGKKYSRKTVSNERVKTEDTGLLPFAYSSRPNFLHTHTHTHTQNICACSKLPVWFPLQHPQRTVINIKNNTGTRTYLRWTMTSLITLIWNYVNVRGASRK